MKKASIIVPCYNVEQYIEQCMDSLVCQTMGIDNLEIIAVNDASTDGTLEILMRFEKRYPDSVLVIDCKENGKQGTARNIGLSYASADYVSFVDADDWVELCAYEQLHAKAVEYGCDAVACGYVEETTREAKPMSGEDAPDAFYIVENDTERGGFLGVDFGIGFAGNLYRKAMLTEHDIYFPEGCFFEDDYWYVLSMHYINRAYVIGAAYYHYFQHPQSTVHQKNSLHHLDRARVEELKLQELMRRGIYQRFPELYEHEFLQRYYMQMLYILFTQFDDMPYTVIVSLHDNAYEMFPDYRQNPFVETILQGKGGKYMKHVYEALDKEFTVARIDALKEECLQDNGSWIDLRI